MKKIIFTILIIGIIFLLYKMINGSAETSSGMIFLQVEENGEAWYQNPTDGKRYYLGNPTDAFEIIKSFALGSTDNFLLSEKFPKRLAGRILINTEKNGEAYYINPKDLKKYYLGKPDDAFKIMTLFGRGISNQNLSKIPVGSVIFKTETNKKNQENKIILNVPFSSQAPFGEWSDPRQQNGCEEISVFMAISWARGEKFTKEQARKEITNTSEFELKEYGEYTDTSAADTLKRLINGYYKFENAELHEDITLSDIISELKKGHAVIVPIDGRAINNPYYTYPGPDRHMMVIRGYDESKNIFITNDPGTRKGELYEYDAQLLYDSIRDYPTGEHVPVKNTEKNIIAVWK